MHHTSARADFEPLYLEKFKERPQAGTITLQVLHDADSVTPVTVPLNDSMSALMDAIAAAMAAARLEQAQALSAQSFLRGCVSRKGRDETRGDVQAVAERINAPPTPPVKIHSQGNTPD